MAELEVCLIHRTEKRREDGEVRAAGDCGNGSLRLQGAARFFLFIPSSSLHTLTVHTLDFMGNYYYDNMAARVWKPRPAVTSSSSPAYRYIGQKIYVGNQTEAL